MSFKARMSQMSSNMLPVPVGTSGINGRGALGFVVDKGERYAAAFGYGYMKGKLHESSCGRAWASTSSPASRWWPAASSPTWRRAAARIWPRISSASAMPACLRT